MRPQAKSTKESWANKTHQRIRQTHQNRHHVGFGRKQRGSVAGNGRLVAHGCDVLTLGQYLQPTKCTLKWLNSSIPIPLPCIKEEGMARGFAFAESPIGAIFLSRWTSFVKFIYVYSPQPAAIGQIASTVLMLGWPVAGQVYSPIVFRKCTTRQRCAKYAGIYRSIPRGKLVTVMAPFGMGAASTGIYAYEFIHHYGVKQLIRVGSTGSIQSHVNVNDIVIAQGASTDSNFADQFLFCQVKWQHWQIFNCWCWPQTMRNRWIWTITWVMWSQFRLFLSRRQENWKSWAKMGILALEMEAHALYLFAARAGVKALTLLTVSDSLVTGQALVPMKENRDLKKWCCWF